MALTIKHLNGDASFLLTFEPLLPVPIHGVKPRPFRVLLDPWITGPSKIFHPKISISTHKEPACVSSLKELPEPDVVIISQHKSDHCHEATLRQLPGSGTKTIILAEPASARLIRSWKYFDKEKVWTIPKWEDPRVTGREGVVRIAIPPLLAGGEMGEVTIAFIPQKRDMSGLHGAIGITYRPPPATSPVSPISAEKGLSLRASATAVPALLTPPVTPRSPKSPRSHKSFSHLSSVFRGSSATPKPYPEFAHLVAGGAPPTPTSPGLSLRSVRSASSLPLSPLSYLAPSPSPSPLPSGSHTTTLSVIFSPHGISYPSLHGYALAHLAASEAALPLTALLHCFDSVSNPWWLGGNILLGAPAGAETAARLRARAWVSAHDGDKDVRGLATGLLRTRKWAREEVEDVVGSPRGTTNAAAARDGESAGGGDGHAEDPTCRRGAASEKGTEVLALACGEEVVLTSEGVWNAATPPRSDRVLSGLAGLADEKSGQLQRLGIGHGVPLRTASPGAGLGPLVEERSLGSVLLMEQEVVVA